MLRSQDNCLKLLGALITVAKSSENCEIMEEWCDLSSNLNTSFHAFSG